MRSCSMMRVLQMSQEKREVYYAHTWWGKELPKKAEKKIGGGGGDYRLYSYAQNISRKLKI